MLILVFIFLTPKSWFSSAAFSKDQTPVTVLLSADVPCEQIDRGELHRRVGQLSGRTDAKILDCRNVYGDGGRITAYEVDIR